MDVEGNSEFPVQTQQQAIEQQWFCNKTQNLDGFEQQRKRRRTPYDRHVDTRRVSASHVCCQFAPQVGIMDKQTRKHYRRTEW